MAEPFKVHGLSELRKALEQLPKELVSKKGGPVKSALMSAALPVMRQAQQTVPDRDSDDNSGRLMQAVARKRVTKTRASRTQNREAVIVYIKAGKSREDARGAFYAPFVEFGAKGLSATEWLSNSLEDNVEKSTKIFREKLAGHIERIARKIGAQNQAKVAAQVKKYKTL